MKQRLILALWLALSGSMAAAQTTTTPPTTPAPAQAAPAPATPAPAAPTTPRPPAANYVIVGDVYYGQGKYDQAYVAYRAATEIDPKNLAAQLGLGRSQVKLRLFEPAIATFKTMTRLDPKGVNGYTALSQAYIQQYMLSSDRNAVKNNLDLALGVLKDAETLVGAQTGADHDLNLSKVFNERGYVYRLQGKAGEAIDSFKKASTLNPDNSTILFNLGDMYNAIGDTAQAISSLQQAVVTDPRDAYNRAYYAKLLAQSGNVTQGRTEAAQAAKLAPTNAYAVGQYGVVSYLAKDPVTARAQLTQAVALDPLRYPEFYFYLGRLALDAADLKTARENLTKAAALSSNTPEYLYYLGLSYERGAGLIAPDKLTARDNYQKALKINPKYQAAIDGLNRVK